MKPAWRSLKPRPIEPKINAMRLNFRRFCGIAMAVTTAALAACESRDVEYRYVPPVVEARGPNAPFPVPEPTDKPEAAYPIDAPAAGKKEVGVTTLDDVPGGGSMAPPPKRPGYGGKSFAPPKPAEAAPGAPKPSTAGGVLVGKTVTVEQGDTVFGIARRHNVNAKEIIELELALSDLATVEKRLDKVKRAAKANDKDALAELPPLEAAFVALSDGKPLWRAGLDPEHLAGLAGLQLLTAKPVLYAANVTDAELSGEEGPYLKALRAAVAGEQAEVVPLSAKIEAELSELPPEERKEFLESLGIQSAGLDRLIRAGYHLLGLQTYFTAGVQEVRAWTIHHGDTAPVAAGVIHTDFEKGFIRAETVSYDDFVLHQGTKNARTKGALRSEGKEYVVKDGDVLNFLFNV